MTFHVPVCGLHHFRVAILYSGRVDPQNNVNITANHLCAQHVRILICVSFPDDTRAALIKALESLTMTTTILMGDDCPFFIALLGEVGDVKGMGKVPGITITKRSPETSTYLGPLIHGFSVKPVKKHIENVSKALLSINGGESTRAQTSKTRRSQNKKRWLCAATELAGLDRFSR